MKKPKLYHVDKITDLKDMLKRSVRLYGERNAYLRKCKRTDPYEGVSFNNFKSDVWALGTALEKLGLSGKKVGIIGENRYEWVTSYMAVACGDMTVVPLDRELSSEDIINLINISELSAIIFSPKTAPKLKDIKALAPECEQLICMGKTDVFQNIATVHDLIDKGNQYISAGDQTYENIKIDPEAPNILLFTSGTTAMSKGVVLCHRNIVSNIMAMCSMIKVYPDDIFLSVLPPHHTYECTCGMMAPIYLGACVAFNDGLKHIPANLKEARVTIMLGVPAIFEMVYKRIWTTARSSGMEAKLRKGLKISNSLRKIGIDKRRTVFKTVIDSLGGSIRLFISGAAAINPDVSKGFRDMGISFIQGYGITECSPIVALNCDNYYKDDAAGIPLSCLKVKLWNENSDGVGEIICKGDNVMLGYYKNQAETDAVLKDGWFYTGDLGSIDKDGFIIIEGRKKNIIIAKNGKNVYPEELETFINNSEYVAESMVYSAEDENGDAEIRAQIYPDMNAIKLRLGDNVSDDRVRELMESVVAEVNKRNPVWKFIRKVIVRDEEFAKTTTRKIKRYIEINK